MKKLYIFEEIKENERTMTSEQFPLASFDKNKLKEAIKNKYKYVKFQKRFGAVVDDWGNVAGYIRLVRKVV